MLNMSRTPIINALNGLEREGFIVSEKFRGFYVKPIDIQEAWDLFGVREALERYTVEQAIIKSGPEDMKVLEDKLREHEEYQLDHYNRHKFILDAKFHIQIAWMTKNKAIEKLLRMNLEHVNLRFRLDNADPKRMQPAIQEHHQLIEKMKMKNISESVGIIGIHVQRARDHIIDCLSKEASSLSI